MAHRTKDSDKPLRQLTFSSRVSATTKKRLDMINIRHYSDKGFNFSMSDSLEEIINYYYENVYLDNKKVS